MTFSRWKLKRNSIAKQLVVSSLLFASTALYANEGEQCTTVSLSDPGWSDIGATNGVVITLLESLGYKTDVYLLSVPIGYESLKNGKVDVFMGNWLPAQQKFIDKYQSDIDVVKKNLDGVKFTLAVPKYVYDQGVTDFEDLNKFDEKFQSKIYGIAAGSPANENIQSMIDANDYQLGSWRVVQSSEQGMLAQVTRAVKRKQFITFLAWEPHPMNVNIDLKYLSGGEKYFGPNYGSATIQTLTRKGFSEQCGNVGTLLNNLTFTVDMENEIINSINQNGLKAPEAAKAWIQANPERLTSWLQGVTTIQGKPALPAVKQALSI